MTAEKLNTTRPLVVRRRDVAEQETALHPYLLTIYERQLPRGDSQEDVFKITGAPHALISWLAARIEGGSSHSTTMVRYEYGGPAGESYSWLTLNEFMVFLESLVEAHKEGRTRTWVS